MSEGYDCRVCFDTFYDRNEVICPCKCSGSGKYICKNCLNTYISHDKNDIKYTTCPSCKEKYVRELNIIPQEINNETRDEIIYGVSFLTLVTIGFLYGGKVNSCFVLFLLILYFYSLCIVVTFTYRASYWVWGILILYFSILWLPREYAYILYGLWSIVLFGFLGKNLIDVKWENLKQSKMIKYMQDVKCQMYDFDLGRYVEGIL